MKQMSCFSHEQDLRSVGTVWKVWIDGAARNNPGPAGAGVVIEKNGELLLARGFFLGKKTNNQAEYYALLLSLFFLEQLTSPDDLIHIYSDSQLLVKQLTGEYKVKDGVLRAMHQCARAFLRTRHYRTHHVLREANARADTLANEGIDRALGVPGGFTAFCERYR